MARHVQEELGEGLLVLDGGACQVGIESTIIDCTRGQPVLLRPGAITPDQVQAACRRSVIQKQELSALAGIAPKASGTLDSHYAPRARVRLMGSADLRRALAAERGARGTTHLPQAAVDTPSGLAVWARSMQNTTVDGVLLCPMPDEAALAAQQLFAQLRAFDAQGVTEIWVESPPDAPEWDGVRDRLQRAAH
jgi:L-threonylcarbamoyladenylate synthase